MIYDEIRCSWNLTLYRSGFEPSVFPEAGSFIFKTVFAENGMITTVIVMTMDVFVLNKT